MWLFLGGVSLIVLKWITAFILRLIFGRIAMQYVAIKLGHQALRLWKDHDWSGSWEISWVAVTDVGKSENVGRGEVFKFFNSVAIVSTPISGETSEIYRFVGRLSRNGTILSGHWTDHKRNNKGYHGTFQIRRSEKGRSAVGQWLGFSQNGNLIRTGELKWQKLDPQEEAT
ncbi:hypothetical protein [Henriciella litoralis]|uniref:hypothetical protein n=1 Tax=Henriciella litoralis TaxID=568102 RepID=UPI00111C29CF|nr:hypothetical protein [Henriciella litoralis]